MSVFLSEFAHPRNPYPNYEQLLDSWAEVFGEHNLRPLIFDKSELVDGGVLADFFHRVLGIDELNGLIRSRRHFNKSVSPWRQELRSKFNAIATFKFRDQLEKPAVQASGAIRRNNEWPDFDTAQLIQRLFDPGNERLRQRWSPNRKSLFSELLESEWRC